jgi:autotransporter-associated beta strand protein
MLTLSGDNSYTAGTAALAGTLVVADADALPAGYALTIGAGGTVVLSSGLNVARSAEVQGELRQASHVGAAPVPEPRTVVLLAAAVVAFLSWRCRKRTASS